MIMIGWYYTKWRVEGNIEKVYKYKLKDGLKRKGQMERTSDIRIQSAYS
jgi:hypothetical protein